MFRIVTMAAVLACASPSMAQDQWRHDGTGIAVTDLPDGMRRGTITDNRNDGTDVFVQFGGSDEPVTLYIYRSAYPNPALWFERTRLAMNTNVGSPNEGVAPRSFTLGQAAAPNGLREEIDLPAGGRFRATAVAIAQHGEWIVKVRITSGSRDRAGVAARMDALLAALRLPAATSTPHPLELPGFCNDDTAFEGEPIRGDREAEVAAASVVGVMEFGEARGHGGLAAEPGAWCRGDSAVPARLASLYRRRDGSAWVMLVGDSGMTLSARTLAPVDDGAASYASTPSSTRVAEVYEQLPDPAATINAVALVLVGRASGLAEISVGQGRTPD